MKVFNIYALEPGSGHACGLAKGLSQFGKVNAYWWKKSAYGSVMDNIFSGKIGPQYWVSGLISKYDYLIIVGCGAYDKIKLSLYKTKAGKILNKKKTKIIVTDGGFMRRSAYYNSEFNGVDLFCHPCKIQFATIPAKECYQPLGDLSEYAQPKHDKLTVGHSPFGAVNMTWKGTRQILETVNRFNVNYSLITGKKWSDCLYMKSKCHIFVDQIDHFDGDKFGWRGGIGKSGLEAMLLDCLVICRGKHSGVNIQPPPIAWCTKEDFAEVLDFYIHNPKERNEKIQAQKEWALHYLSYEFGAKNILGEV